MSQETERAAIHTISEAKRDVRVGSVTLILFLSLFVGWAACARLDAGVVAEGTLAVSGNRKVVQHKDGGVVRKLKVREDQHVSKGDVLMELATNELVAEELSLRSRGEQQSRRCTQLRVQLRRVGVTGFPELDYTDFASSSLARDGGSYEAQVSAINTQRSLIDQEIRGVRTLYDKGFAPLTRVRALERAAADIQGQRLRLIGALENDIRTCDNYLADLVPRWRSAKERLEGASVRATATGRVVGLALFTDGGVLQAGQTILSIVPDDEPIIVQTRIHPRDANDVRIGMKSEIRMDAILPRARSQIVGKVYSMSADRVEDVRTGQPYFLAQIEIERGSVERVLRDADTDLSELKAGIPVDVVIPRRSRTALQYLLEPLDRALWMSLRES